MFYMIFNILTNIDHEYWIYMIKFSFHIKVGTIICYTTWTKILAQNKIYYNPAKKKNVAHQW